MIGRPSMESTSRATSSASPISPSSISVSPKTFTVGPVGLTAIAECFNCTNNRNAFVTNTTWGTGQTPSSTFGVANGINTLPRTLQFAGRVDF
jgi:hypothetical protein